MVNKRLGKPEYDCTKLDETYDCGCGDDPTNSTAGDKARMEEAMVKGG